MKAFKAIRLSVLAVGVVVTVTAAPAMAGAPTELLRGEAPLLFTGAEGEDGDSTLLLDGSPIRGDEIWLWVPATVGGQVNLGQTGQFFKVWDSGPEAGPDGNDDDDNGMRGMDFNPATGRFLISYEDSTTTGFQFGPIKDGDLMELTVTSVDQGFVDGFAWNRLFAEGPNGTPGFIGTGDINAISSAADGSLFIGMGGTQTIFTDQPAPDDTVDVNASTLAHLDPNDPSGSPVNIGPDAFFDASVGGSGLIFGPGMYIGQLRGGDILGDDLTTFGTSGNYKNTVFSGPIDGLTDEEAAALAIDVVTVGEKADIMDLPNYGDMSLNTYQRRAAEILYSGSLFFQEPGDGDSELLDHDILDNVAEIEALIALLGADSPAGLALAAHIPEPGSLALLALGGFAVLRRRR